MPKYYSRGTCLAAHSRLNYYCTEIISSLYQQTSTILAFLGLPYHTKISP